MCICVETSQYIKDKERLVAELRDVLKPGGRLLLSFHDYGCLDVKVSYIIRLLGNKFHKLLKKLCAHLPLYYMLGKIGGVIPLKGRRYGIGKNWLRSIALYGFPPYFPADASYMLSLLRRKGFKIILHTGGSIVFVVAIRCP